MTEPTDADDRQLRHSGLMRLRAALPELRPSEQRIAALFLADPVVAAGLSIAALAQRCGTSPTSVVRLCRRLGYQHLRDLRRDVLLDVARDSFHTAALPEPSGDIGRDDSLEDIVANVSLAETLSIADTARALDITALRAAVAAVDRARRIDIFGVGASSFVGLDLQQKLTRIGRTALNWADPHGSWTAAATLTADAVAIAISHSGATLDTVEFLSIARASGASTIAISNHDRSPLADQADVVLTTSARESPFRAGALGSRIAQLMVVDCLFIGVAQARYEESMEAVRTTYAAVNRLRTH